MAEFWPKSRKFRAGAGATYEAIPMASSVAINNHSRKHGSNRRVIATGNPNARGESYEGWRGKAYSLLHTNVKWTTTTGGNWRL